MKYDVFISYRRKGGSERAELLKAVLEKRGYKTERIFMDTHSLLASDFRTKIDEAINESVNVIVIITQGCFDNIKEEDFWIYELSEALRLNKNIIPVFFDGISDITKLNLPQTLQDLPYQNAVKYSHDYSEAFYSKLFSFLIEDKREEKKRTKQIFITTTLIVLFFAALWILGVFLKEPAYETRFEITTNDSVVDLGLPSGTLWGKCNLGAKEMWDNGDYYAWGDIVASQRQPKPAHDDLVNIIGTNYDAAFMVLGKRWSLPTTNQLEELKSCCKWEWECQNNTIGYRVIGRNGNFIFLPAAGCIKKGSVEYLGKYGYYWTGECIKRYPAYGQELLFGPDTISIESGRKNIPRSIRPIYKNVE